MVVWSIFELANHVRSRQMGFRLYQWDGLLLTLNGVSTCQSGEAISQQQVENEFEIKVTRFGVDIAKNVFQVHGAGRSGRAVWRR